jgi:hypothetical protein
VAAGDDASGHLCAAARAAPLVMRRLYSLGFGIRAGWISPAHGDGAAPFLCGGGGFPWASSHQVEAADVGLVIWGSPIFSVSDGW